MAVVKTEKSTKVTLKVETSAGVYANRILNNINPAATDAKIYSLFGEAETSESGVYGLAYYSTYPLNKIIRTDTATIADES